MALSKIMEIIAPQSELLENIHKGDALTVELSGCGFGIGDRVKTKLVTVKSRYRLKNGSVRIVFEAVENE